MPLENTMKDIRAEERKWKEENKKELEKWQDIVKNSDIKDKIKDLFSHERDKNWTPEEKEKLDVLFEKVPPLEKDISIYVKEQKVYLRNNIKKEGANKVVTNEFYIRGNENNNAGDINTLESGQYLLIGHVPAGEKVAYIEEGEQSLLLLRRNTKYTINGPATTVNDESGNEHVIWHVHLVPRELNENSPHDTDSTQKTKVAAFEKLGKNWVDSLDSKEQAAIVYYTGHNYTDINSYLRNNQMDLRSGSSKPELDEKIKSIDSAINKSVLEEDTVLYRNTGERELREKEDFLQHIFNIDLSTTETALSFKEYMDRAMALVQKNLGNTNTALAYTSTTIQKDSVFVGSAIRMEIRVPKGAHGAYVDSISQVKGEMEVLLPRESKFEITGASTVQENGYNVLVIRATLDITRDFNAEKKEAQQWGNKEYESWRNSLTKSSDIDRIGGVKTLEEAAKSECAALQYYSSINYKDINEYLRNGGGKNPSFEKVIEQIDNSLKKAETPETLYVYRRVDELAFGEKQNTLRDQNQKISDEKLNEIKDIVNTFRHKVIPEKSYMSTSLYNASSGLPILIRFKVPKGTHAACLGPVAKSVAKLDDGELLIARGSSYTIKAVERKTDKQGRDYLQVEATLNKN